MSCETIRFLHAITAPLLPTGLPDYVLVFPSCQYGYFVRNSGTSYCTLMIYNNKKFVPSIGFEPITSFTIKSQHHLLLNLGEVLPTNGLLGMLSGGWDSNHTSSLLHTLCINLSVLYFQAWSIQKNIARHCATRLPCRHLPNYLISIVSSRIKFTFSTKEVIRS